MAGRGACRRQDLQPRSSDLRGKPDHRRGDRSGIGPLGHLLGQPRHCRGAGRIEPPQPAAKGPIGYAGWCARIGDHDVGQGFNGPIGSAIAAWVAKNGADHDPGWLRTDIEKVIRRADASRHTSAEIENRISQLDDRIKWTREREAQ